MTTSGRRASALANLRQVERRAELVRSDLDAALARVEATESEPDQPKRNSIIKFQVQFTADAMVYTYVAYRAPSGDWYRTGDKAVYSWETMLDFMYRDVTSKKLGVGFYLFSGKGGRWIGRQP